MKGIKKIWMWGKKYLHIVIGIVLMSTVLQWLYAYLPLFVQYAFERLSGGDVKTDLPKFLINFYENIDDTLTCLSFVGLSMICLQAFRSFLRFLDNYYQGALAHFIGHDMRVKIYNHVMDLSYS